MPADIGRPKISMYLNDLSYAYLSELLELIKNRDITGYIAFPYIIGMKIRAIIMFAAAAYIPTSVVERILDNITESI